MGRKPAHLQGDTLGDIKAAAFRLFGHYGFDGVSMSQLAKAAGITKATLYWHFDSKEAVFLASISQLEDLYRTYVIAPVLQETTPPARLLRMFTGMADMIQDPKLAEGIAGFWIDPSTADVQAAKDGRKQFRAMARALIEQVLLDGIENGDFVDDLPVEGMGRAVTTILEAVIIPLHLDTWEETVSIIAPLAATFFRAYATDKSWVDKISAGKNNEFQI